MMNAWYDTVDFARFFNGKCVSEHIGCLLSVCLLGLGCVLRGTGKVSGAENIIRLKMCLISMIILLFQMKNLLNKNLYLYLFYCYSSVVTVLTR